MQASKQEQDGNASRVFMLFLKDAKSEYCEIFVAFLVFTNVLVLLEKMKACDGISKFLPFIELAPLTSIIPQKISSFLVVLCIVMVFLLSLKIILARLLFYIERCKSRKDDLAGVPTYPHYYSVSFPKTSIGLCVDYIQNSCRKTVCSVLVSACAFWVTYVTYYCINMRPAEAIEPIITMLLFIFFLYVLNYLEHCPYTLCGMFAIIVFISLVFYFNFVK